MELWRGTASNLSSADKRGGVSCQVGERNVRLHPELTSSVKAGEDVLVGGEVRDNVMSAYAVKNFSTNRVIKIDYTFSMLFIGLGGFLTLLGLVLGAQSLVAGKAAGESMFALMAVAGVALVFVMIRRIARISQVSRWVSRVEK